jgi:hypothetical protein
VTAVEVTFPLKPDGDGFLTQECPYCNRAFKVAFGLGSADSLRYCPYCGMEGHVWFTVAQQKYLQSKAAKGTGRMPVESSVSMEIYEFACDGDRIKHDGKEETLYCIACGTAHPVSHQAPARKRAARQRTARKPAGRKSAAKKKPPRKARS